MKLSLMTRKLDRMPMLRLLVPFAAGIVLAERFTLPLWFAAGVFVFGGVLAILLRSSAWTVAMLAAAGFGASQLHATEPAVPRGVVTEFELVVGGIPSDRGRYTTAEGVVTAWRDPADGSWRAVRDRVRLSADSLTPLDAGERIRCRGAIRPFGTAAGGYGRLMTRRGVAGTLYLSERSVLERLPERERSLHSRAVARFERLGARGDAGAVVRAMTTGDRSRITSEVREVYARSGFSHLLAVSGLHTGIVFMLINLLLWWMPLLRRGIVWRNVAVVAGVWLFVAAAGFPASAVRAAVMCSALQFTLAAGQVHSGMNALSLAAFAMLLYNPAWVGDISFQLSFVAVAGILTWGVPLCRRVRTRRRILDTVIQAFIISFAATLATAPLISHTFGIVPLVGILTNPPAILLATAAVGAGVVWMIAPLGLLASVVRWVAEVSAGGIGELARWTAAVPGGVVEYTLPAGWTAAVYGVFVVGTALAWCAEPKKSVHLPRR